MGNQINKIHYAVSIETDYTGTDIPSIGLYGSTIRYVTDGYNTSASTYEDTSPVTGTWNTSLLTRKGISPSNQSIDIITGGDYAFLGSLKIEIININAIQETLLETEGLYLIGSIVKLYVVIDGVFYSRGVFSLSEYAFSDKSFTFIAKDQHNSDNNTIKDTTFGNVTADLDLVVDEEEALLEEQFIKLIETTNSDIVTYNMHERGSSLFTYPDVYVGFEYGGGLLASSDSNSYKIYISGKQPTIDTTMFLKFRGDNTWYNILSVETGTITTTTLNTTDYTKIEIGGLSPQITDFTQFYGIQPNDETNNEIAIATNITDDDILAVSIYKSGLRYTIPADAEVLQEDGKFIVEDSAGNTHRVDGVIIDNTLTITSTTITDIVYPNTVRELVEQGDEDSVRNKLKNGTLKHTESLAGLTGVTIPKTLDGSDYHITPKGKRFYYFLDFDVDIESYTLGTTLNAMVDAKENWSMAIPILQNVQQLVSIQPGFANIPPSDQTEYYSSVIDSWEKTNESFFSSWVCTQYKVVTENDFGDVPFLSHDFMIPNLRNKTAGKVIFGVNLGAETNARVNNFESKSSLGTNLPKDVITYTNPFISSYTPTIEWQRQEAGSDLYYYPKQQIPWTINQDTPATTATYKALLKIEPFGYDSAHEYERIVYDSSTDASNRQLVKSNDGTIFGIGTICAYKTDVLSPSTTLLFKTVNDTNDTYDKVIKELSGSTSDLTNRSTWYVGNNITDEVNTFNIVTNLCKAGMVAGFSDRVGDVSLVTFNETGGVIATHNDDIILNKSLTKFQLSSIAKCYNEFTIKYHYVGGQHQKELGLYHVDEDAFPNINDIEYGWSQRIDLFNIASALTTGATTGDLMQYYIDSDQTQIVDMLDNNTYEQYKLDMYAFPPTDPHTLVFKDPVLVSTAGGQHLYDVTYVSGDWFKPNQATSVPGFYNSTAISALWETYIVGINNYADAKSLWDKAHGSWLINKRIRTAPTERTDLKWAVDLNEFYGVDTYDDTFEYAKSYFNLLIDWTTKQKLMVQYTLPLTPDTAKLNLIDKIHFNDKIIIPDPNGFGVGWITSIQLDTNKDLIKIGLTFETDFYSQPMAIQCPSIIETGDADINIIETGSQTDNIYDGCNL